jgi:hypothetical protein
MKEQGFHYGPGRRTKSRRISYDHLIASNSVEFELIDKPEI